MPVQVRSISEAFYYLLHFAGITVIDIFVLSPGEVLVDRA